MTLQTYSVHETCQVCHTKIQNFKGGHSRTLSLQIHGVLEVCKVYNGAMHKFKGGRWRYKLTVSLKLARSIPYKDSNIQGVTLDLQTYSVIQTCKVYHTKIHKFKGGRWRYKLTVWLKFAQPTIHR